MRLPWHAWLALVLAEPQEPVEGPAVDDFDFSRVSFAQPVASSEDFEDAFLEA